MRNRVVVLTGLLALALLLSATAAGVAWGISSPQRSATITTGHAASLDLDAPLAEQPANGADPLVLSYAAKFICTEALQPGMHWYGPAAPIVQEKTDVLVHNPHDFKVNFYKKAVIAPLEESPPVAPGNWKQFSLDADHAFRIDCDDIAKLLTGNPAATFIGTYGIGVTVEGFVVIAVGPQTPATGALRRYTPLDVTAEYMRGSEVLKKDINFQPWWRWWWWSLPWRLAYPYERLVQIDPAVNIDCRGLLYNALQQDAARVITDPQELALTQQALQAGQAMGPDTILSSGPSAEPALVALVGRCAKIDPLTAEVDYVLVSNKGPSDHDPRTPTSQPEQVLYPWYPGRWYDLPVVIPQNVNIDLDDYMYKWHSQLWINAGAPVSDVNQWMPYFFPYWCGWGYWYWWWNGSDCTDIGVGEGESLDVEQITPMRVFMAQWPPP